MLSLSDLKPGTTLGRYEILMPVAKGGMAAVWAARMVGSRGFQKIVAIKTMLPTISEDPDFEAMFLDEARVASRIRHPHVAEILDLGDENGVLYIVMEWVAGETLFVLNRQAKEHGGFPLPVLLRMLSAASAGLHAAHELRDDEGRPLEIVHRDVNPQNVMVSYEGIVKIVDFGVAKAAALVHNTRVPGMIKGKVHYLSPEQIRGDKLDRRSDIFSLGILMYVMISGRHPFKADTDKQTMDNIVGRDPVPLHKLVPDVRPELEAVVMRALEKDVSKRWPDCAEIQRALDQIIGLLGTTVTDGDVSKFVRKVMGDRSEQRRAELAAAIQAADARGPGADGPASRRRAGPASVRPGSERNRGAMPSIFEGIIPVALEDTPPPPSATPLPPPIATPVVVEPLPSLRPPAPRRRSGPGVVGGALLLLLGAAGATGSALYLGYLPDLAERLPGPLRALAPAASAAPSATPTAVPSAAPTASSTTTAIATAAAPVDVNAALNTASTDAGATDAGATDAGSADAGPLDAGRLPPWGTDGGPPPGWFKPRNKQGTTGASGSSNSP